MILRKLRTFKQVKKDGRETLIANAAIIKVGTISCEQLIYEIFLYSPIDWNKTKRQANNT